MRSPFPAVFAILAVVLSASAMQAQPQIATLITPANGASNIDPTYPIQFTWTSVSDEQAYYLYVGTTLGGKDVVNSGETQQTSWSAYVGPGAGGKRRVGISPTTAEFSPDPRVVRCPGQLWNLCLPVRTADGPDHDQQCRYASYNHSAKYVRLGAGNRSVERMVRNLAGAIRDEHVHLQESHVLSRVQPSG